MATRTTKNLFRLSACALFLIAIARAPIAFSQQPAAAASATNGPAPKIAVARTTYDFGEIFRGEGIGYVFVIKNEGAADLVIEEFTPS